MTTIPVNLAIEDSLSEAVLRRVLKYVNRGFVVGTAYGRSGHGYLRKTIRGWNRAAKGVPFVVLTDLDSRACPSELINDWLAEPQHPNLLIRVAVREVEAWLMGDAKNLSSYLAVHPKWMPAYPDDLPDPKRTLVELAGKSKSSDIRDRLVPRKGSTAKQGRDHNGCLSGFVYSEWDIAVAQAKSPSLRRTVQRFKAFEPTWNIAPPNPR